mgnify:CR=1 FL=1
MSPWGVGRPLGHYKGAVDGRTVPFQFHASAGHGPGLNRPPSSLRLPRLERRALHLTWASDGINALNLPDFLSSFEVALPN